MNVCESCSTIASLTDTAILLSGSVPGCGKCRHEDFNIDDHPPSHPGIIDFVYLHDRDGYRREKVVSMTGVRSESSALFTLEELGAADERQRAAAKDQTAEISINYSLQRLIAATEQPRRSLDGLAALGVVEASPMAPPALDRAERDETSPRSWASFATVGLALLLVGAFFSLWLVAGERGVAAADHQPRIIATSTVGPPPTRPAPSLERSLASATFEPDPSPIMRIDPIIITAPSAERAAPEDPLPRASSAPERGLGPTLPSRSTTSHAGERDGEASSPTPDAVMTLSMDREVGEASNDTDREPTAGGALAERSATGRSDLEETAELPQTLTRAQITRGLREVTRLARNCADGLNQVRVRLSIEGATGQVLSARVNGPLTGSIEGRCVERALQRARFPRFDDQQLTVRSFPLILR